MAVVLADFPLQRETQKPLSTSTQGTLSSTHSRWERTGQRRLNSSKMAGVDPHGACRCIDTKAASVRRRGDDGPSTKLAKHAYGRKEETMLSNFKAIAVGAMALTLVGCPIINDGPDAGPDAGTTDAGTTDAGTTDAAVQPIDERYFYSQVEPYLNSCRACHIPGQSRDTPEGRSGFFLAQLSWESYGPMYESWERLGGGVESNPILVRASETDPEHPGVARWYESYISYQNTAKLFRCWAGEADCESTLCIGACDSD